MRHSGLIPRASRQQDPRRDWRLSALENRRLKVHVAGESLSALRPSTESTVPLHLTLASKVYRVEVG